MSHLSSFQIDALAAGFLAADEHARATEHVAACERCGADLEATKHARSHFTREVLPRTLPRRTPWWRRWLPVIAVPVLAAAAFVLWLGGRHTVAREEPDLRIKGDITFQVFAKRGAEVIQVRDGTPLRAGDAIRFVAGATRANYLLIGSVDGAGKPTLYYPYGGPRSGAVTKVPAELPGSVVLDAAPGPERLFALFSSEPLDGAAVTAALSALGARGADAIHQARTLPVGATAQATLVFEKVTP